jgi:hypothetical protein
MSQYFFVIIPRIISEADSLFLLWATNCNVIFTYPYFPPTASHIMHPSPPLTQTHLPPPISPSLFLLLAAWLDMLGRACVLVVRSRVDALLVLLVFACASVCLWRKDCVHFIIIVSHNIGELGVPPLAKQAMRPRSVKPCTASIIKRWKGQHHIVWIRTMIPTGSSSSTLPPAQQVWSLLLSSTW